MVAYNRVRILGGMPGGEVWSINPAFGGTAPALVDNFEDLLTWATSIAALNSNQLFPTVLRQLLSNALTITGVRTEYFNAAGDLTAAAEYLYPSPVTGSTEPTLPYQSAMVVSLLTGRPGRSYRGRLYLPLIATSLVSTTLRIPGSIVTAALADVAGFLQDVQEAIPVGYSANLCVVSQTLDTTTAVSSLRIGNIIDSQNRRRDALVEAYQTLVYA